MHARPSKPRNRLLRTILGVAILVGLVGAIGVAALVKPLPPPVAQRLVPLSLIVPGVPWRLPGPPAGESALVTRSGISLGAAGPTSAVPIASVSKIMTAYLVLRDHPLAPGQAGPTLTITPTEAANLAARIGEGQSVLVVQSGEQLSEYQALEALLVPSANNIADALARFDATTTTAFVAKMNAMATAVGMDHTQYADASGYSPQSVSTAADQLILARAALAIPDLAAIVALPSVTLPGVGTVANYDSLVGHDGFEGIKTGSTPAAGGCLVFAVTRVVAGQRVTLLGAVLGQRSGPYVSAALAAARALADAGFAELRPRTVLSAGTPVLTVRRAGQITTDVTAGPLSTIAPPGTPVAVTVSGHRSGSSSLRSDTSVSLHVAATTDTTAILASPLPPPTLWWRLAHLV